MPQRSDIRPMPAPMNMTPRVMAVRSRQRPGGSGSVGPVQRLDLGLLIDTHGDGVLRRLHLRPDDVADVRVEFGVGGELERLDPPGLQVPVPPDPGDGRESEVISVFERRSEASNTIRGRRANRDSTVEARTQPSKTARSGSTNNNGTR